MRLFVCSLLEAGNQDFYDGRVAEFVAASRGSLRPVPKRSAHLTHAFLGEVDAGRLDDIRTAVESASKQRAAVPIRLGPPAIVFARSTPRLVCAHVIHGAVQLRQLMADVAMALEPVCPGASLAPAHAPHVTLARFRKGAGPKDARVVIAALDAESTVTREDAIASIQIVSSVLGPDGPAYTVMADIGLRVES
jgi:2'-5' RNA ligase